MQPNRSFPWLPVLGALVALFVIFLVHQQTQQANMALEATFAQQAALMQTEIALSKTVTALTPQPEMPQIGLDDLKKLMPTALASLPGVGGTPEPAAFASGTIGGMLVEVTEVAPATDGSHGVIVRGRVTNVGQSEITVPITIFELIDTAGATYTPGPGPQAVLKPGENTPLELSVPLPSGRGLKLMVNMQNETPLELKVRDETLEPGAPA